jgi:AcrR family transcriptional regulator
MKPVALASAPLSLSEDALSEDALSDGRPEAGPRPGKRVTRRRAQTRERLLAAAFEVFAERGLGAATVEEVCERAGYTRGAFYSNFATMEELFFALYEQRANEMLARTRATISAVLDEAATTGVIGDDLVEAAVDGFLVNASRPYDRSWWLVTTEYLLHAARNPEAARRLGALRRQSQDEFVKVVVAALRRARRVSTVSPDQLTRALEAVYEGAILQQSYADPGSATYEEVHRLALPVVIRGLTRLEEAPGSGAGTSGAPG